MEASDYRRIARENLKNSWIPAAIVTFVAALLGGAVVGGSFSLEIDEEVLYYLPDVVVTIFLAMAGFASFLSLVQFVIGGTVQLGHAQYLLKQYDRRDCDFDDLFSQFHRFGAGFCQSFLRGLYVFLWSLLLVIPGIIAGYS